MSTQRTTPSEAELQAMAKDHLWMHFTRQSTMDKSGVPIIVKGDGHRIWAVSYTHLTLPTKA